jgi:hypothetical protein
MPQRIPRPQCRTAYQANVPAPLRARKMLSNDMREPLGCFVRHWTDKRIRGRGPGLKEAAGCSGTFQSRVCSFGDSLSARVR